MNPLRAAINRAVMSSIVPWMQFLIFGDVLRQDLKQEGRFIDPAADAAQLSTLEQVGVSDSAPAAAILRARSRVSGNSVTGELTVKGYGATPGTGEVAVAPNGDVVVLAADQITSLDLVYVPEAGELVELDLVVASNQATIPAAYVARGVLLLRDANATVGTTTGRKIITVPATSAPAATKACLTLPGDKVNFHSSDAVTNCHVKLWVGRKIRLGDALDADSNIL